MCGGKQVKDKIYASCPHPWKLFPHKARDTNLGPTLTGLFCADLTRTLTHWMWTTNGSIHSQSTTFTASRHCDSSFLMYMLNFLSGLPPRMSPSRSPYW